MMTAFPGVVIAPEIEKKIDVPFEEKGGLQLIARMDEDLYSTFCYVSEATGQPVKDLVRMQARHLLVV